MPIKPINPIKLTNLKRWYRSLQTRSTLAIIITAGVLIEVTSAVQYWYARKGIREEVERRAVGELKVRNLEIEKIVNAVESASDYTVWMLEKSLDSPAEQASVIEKILKVNPNLVGCGIGFKPYYYASKGRWYEPYYRRSDDGGIQTMQIGSESHDYVTADWYAVPMKSGKGYWTEPYYDDAGGKVLMITYAQPILDEKGNAVAVLGMDLSLDWLTKTLNVNHFYPSSFNLVVSRTGKLMACPVESLVMRRSLMEVTTKYKDTTVHNVNRKMLAGESGQATIIDEQGEKNYVFFAPISRDTSLTAGEQLGWSMAVVCSDSEIYRGLRQVGFNLMLLMIAGMALLVYILLRTVRGYRNLQEANTERERMNGELGVAKRIQHAMLPEKFPPFPERGDIDIYALQNPARQVGGDLYDYVLRDEKLFFCVGDVSGKGVPAAMVMAMAQSVFRLLVARESSPERIVTQMNELLTHDNEYNIFITFFIGVLDLPTGRLRYCNAGHKPPVLLGQGSDELPCTPNLPLGALPDWKYCVQETVVEPGTTMFLFTDGLTEAENEAHELFSKKRMMQSLTANQSQAPHDIVTSMTEAVKTFVGDTEQSDDLTMLAIRYTRSHTDVQIRRTLTLHNDIAEVPVMAEFVDAVCEEVKLDASAVMQVNLAIEEAVVNVMNYAYPSGTQGEITLLAEADTSQLKFILTDSGKPFDPTTHAEVDTTLSAEKRGIGGLGIHLMRRYMDSINYERIGDQNVLTLCRKLNNSPETPL